MAARSAGLALPPVHPQRGSASPTKRSTNPDSRNEESPVYCISTLGSPRLDVPDQARHDKTLSDELFGGQARIAFTKDHPPRAVPVTRNSYNSLHDPHVREYYLTNPASRTHLVKSGFISEDACVIGSPADLRQGVKAYRLLHEREELQERSREKEKVRLLRVRREAEEPASLPRLYEQTLQRTRARQERQEQIQERKKRTAEEQADNSRLAAMRARQAAVEYARREQAMRDEEQRLRLREQRLRSDISAARTTEQAVRNLTPLSRREVWQVESARLSERLSARLGPLPPAPGHEEQQLVPDEAHGAQPGASGQLQPSESNQAYREFVFENRPEHANPAEAQHNDVEDQVAADDGNDHPNSETEENADPDGHVSGDDDDIAIVDDGSDDDGLPEPRGVQGAEALLADRRRLMKWWSEHEAGEMQRLQAEGIAADWFEETVLDTVRLADLAGTGSMRLSDFLLLVSVPALGLALKPIQLDYVANALKSESGTVNCLSAVLMLRQLLLDACAASPRHVADEWCELYYPRRGCVVHYNKSIGQTQLAPPLSRQTSLHPTRPVTEGSIAKALQRVFEHFDPKRTGSLDEIFFSLLLQSRLLGLTLSSAQADRVLSDLAPADGNGSVSYRELIDECETLIPVACADATVSGWCRLYAPPGTVFFYNKRTGQTRTRRPAECLFDDKGWLFEEVLRDVFAAVDASKSGLVPEEDFWEMLEAPPPAGLDLSETDSFTMMQLFDREESGLISARDFIAVARVLVARTGKGRGPLQTDWINLETAAGVAFWFSKYDGAVTQVLSPGEAAVHGFGKVAPLALPGQARTPAISALPALAADADAPPSPSSSASQARRRRVSFADEAPADAAGPTAMSPGQQAVAQAVVDVLVDGVIAAVVPEAADDVSIAASISATVVADVMRSVAAGESADAPAPDTPAAPTAAAAAESEPTQPSVEVASDEAVQPPADADDSGEPVVEVQSRTLVLDLSLAQPIDAASAPAGAPAATAAVVASEPLPVVVATVDDSSSGAIQPTAPITPPGSRVSSARPRSAGRPASGRSLPAPPTTAPPTTALSPAALVSTSDASDPAPRLSRPASSRSVVVPVVAAAATLSAVAVVAAAVALTVDAPPASPTSSVGVDTHNAGRPVSAVRPTSAASLARPPSARSLATAPADAATPPVEHVPSVSRPQSARSLVPTTAVAPAASSSPARPPSASRPPSARPISARSVRAAASPVAAANSSLGEEQQPTSTSARPSSARPASARSVAVVSPPEASAAADATDPAAVGDNTVTVELEPAAALPAQASAVTEQQQVPVVADSAEPQALSNPPPPDAVVALPVAEPVAPVESLATDARPDDSPADAALAVAVHQEPEPVVSEASVVEAVVADPAGAQAPAIEVVVVNPSELPVPADTAAGQPEEPSALEVEAAARAPTTVEVAAAETGPSAAAPDAVAGVETAERAVSESTAPVDPTGEPAPASHEPTEAEATAAAAVAVAAPDVTADAVVPADDTSASDTAQDAPVAPAAEADAPQAVAVQDSPSAASLPAPSAADDPVAPLQPALEPVAVTAAAPVVISGDNSASGADADPATPAAAVLEPAASEPAAPEPVVADAHDPAVIDDAAVPDAVFAASPESAVSEPAAFAEPVAMASANDSAPVDPVASALGEKNVEDAHEEPTPAPLPASEPVADAGSAPTTDVRKSEAKASATEAPAAPHAEPFPATEAPAAPHAEPFPATEAPAAPHAEPFPATEAVVEPAAAFPSDSSAPSTAAAPATDPVPASNNINTVTPASVPAPISAPAPALATALAPATATAPAQGGERSL